MGARAAPQTLAHPVAYLGGTMEALLLVLDGLAFVVLVYMGLRDDRQPPGVRHKSFFRILAQGELSPREAAKQALRERQARSRA